MINVFREELVAGGNLWRGNNAALRINSIPLENSRILSNEPPSFQNRKILMSISDLLLPEFDEEARKTRIALQRVPMTKGEFVPHPKSMPLKKLAPHVAQLAGFGLTVLTTPGLDFATTKI